MSGLVGAFSFGPPIGQIACGHIAIGDTVCPSGVASSYIPPVLLSGGLLSGQLHTLGVTSGGMFCGNPTMSASWMLSGQEAGIVSGYGSTIYHCSRCGGDLFLYAAPYVVWPRITLSGVQGTHYYCHKCISFNMELRRPETREDWLREGVSGVLAGDVPCYALADWLEEQGRYADAAWLRKERNGR